MPILTRHAQEDLIAIRRFDASAVGQHFKDTVEVVCSGLGLEGGNMKLIQHNESSRRLGSLVGGRIPTRTEKLHIGLGATFRVATTEVDINSVDSVVMQHHKAAISGLWIGTGFAGRVSELDA
jgi:hypothetical protein